MARSESVLITPEMVEAGALVLREHADLGPNQSRHLAEYVFTAMRGAEQPSIVAIRPGQYPKKLAQTG